MPEHDAPPDIVTSSREFFELRAISRDEIWRTVSRIDQASQAAEAAFRKRMAALVSTWLAAYAISVNVVMEGGVGSFKLAQLPVLVLVAPLVLALLQHNGLAIVLASKVAAAIERSAYRKLFPESTRRHIDAITFSVTQLGLEGVITGRTLRVGRVLWLSSGIMLVLIFVAPFLLVGHAIYLALISTRTRYG